MKRNLNPNLEVARPHRESQTSRYVARCVLIFWLLFVTHLASGQNIAFDADKWEKTNEATLISDMTKVVPKTALTFDVRRKRHWKVLDYETVDGLKGKCITSTPDTGAPNVTLPLNVKGWYAVYVGLGGVGRFAFGQGNEVRLKLTNDVTYQHRAYAGARDDIEEVFFKAADLSGQSLQIAQMRMQAKMGLQPDNNPRHTVVMYVKLIPLTKNEVNWIEKDRSQTKTKRLIATMDAFSWINQNHPTTKEEFLEDFEHLRDTDFGTIYWQIIGGDLVNYKSKLGTIPGELSDDPARTGDGYVTDSIKKFIASGEDETKMAIEASHSMGKKIMIGFRVQAWQTPPAFEDYFTSRFYRDHPEWRTYDRDGTPVMRMSYAVPEVRQHIYGILREVLAYQPDGIEIIYFRGLPLMLWEDAFCKQFREKYRADAKKVPEDDPRLYELREEIMTGFMRDIRKMMDDVQKKQGRKQRYELTASVVHNEADNRKYGLDVERWVKEGLVDRIGIFPAAFHTDTRKPMELDWFCRITKGTSVGVYPMMLGWKLPSAKQALVDAQKYYKGGAAGIIFWDPSSTDFYNPGPSQESARKSYTNPGRTYFPLASRLGHVDALPELAAEDRPKSKFVPLKRFGNYWLGRWIPDVGF